jgi:hypothetical protein
MIDRNAVPKCWSTCWKCVGGYWRLKAARTWLGGARIKYEVLGSLPERRLSRVSAAPPKRWLTCVELSRLRVPSVTRR